ncbi:MAG: hypothetical protein ACD_78C00316G0001 [uncultured bacterium (gcode 4)]|uniref:Uncharacterized protein n=1 Tax=uncultured bacterium (gcode 4) TaxID=1234023 RepID=K1XHB3_9BACT|nr:MAG: hypothetical protein ACD_78C00316G0001 [uncultured bacterium (gcode 4)]
MAFCSESIDDFHSFRSENDCLRNLSGKPVAPFREDDFLILFALFCLLNQVFQTLTHTSVSVNREKNPIYRFEGFDDLHSEILILKAFASSFKLGLSIIIDDNPKFVCSCFRFREFETFDMPRMERICVHGSDGEDGHRKDEMLNIMGSIWRIPSL